MAQLCASDVNKIACRWHRSFSPKLFGSCGQAAQAEYLQPKSRKDSSGQKICNCFRDKFPPTYQILKPLFQERKHGIKTEDSLLSLDTRHFAEQESPHGPSCNKYLFQDITEDTIKGQRCCWQERSHGCPGVYIIWQRGALASSCCCVTALRGRGLWGRQHWRYRLPELPGASTDDRNGSS